jgi:transposase
MAYREVTSMEIKEVLWQWMLGAGVKTVAQRVGMDVKTARRFVRIAEELGLTRHAGVEALDDAWLARLHARLGNHRARPRGDAWGAYKAARSRIDARLAAGVSLAKVHRELRRDGVLVPYATLHRFVVDQLAFGRPATTLPVVDGKPGEELQVDTCWLEQRIPDSNGRMRRLNAWVVCPSVSRYRFVYPIFDETTASAIDACKAAWAFYGGVFHVLIVDNTKAIVVEPDALTPRLQAAFLEYSQARGFVVDPARVRRPTDKARVERSVRYVRQDCFGGESFASQADARAHAERWCRETAGLKRHSRTYRTPREHFDAVERPELLAAPTDRYDLPVWSSAKVARDHYAQVARGLYSLPTRFIGRTLTVRADRALVRFYHEGVLVKTHARVEPGRRATDTADLPPNASTSTGPPFVCPCFGACR